ncbi:MAG: NADP-dependent malic enzyme [Candidatus Atribacteria bacterium]|nr:NADP-dependent malic enzyme [Candidatus Atribacteria bacterium]
MLKKSENELRQPLLEAMKLHQFYQGKIEVTLKCPVRTYDDFAIWYTPGVAEVCRAIAADPALSFTFTGRWNTVAVVSNGTRVLGLGNIGPEAALPVMEGKALLFRYLGGVDSWPLCLRTRNADELIQVVESLEPSFGGINLEDISQPDCFYILETLQKRLHIPVWHDDQQGTALVTVAGFLGALDVVEKEIDQVRIALVGSGASNMRVAHLLMKAGVPGENIVLCDRRGTLHRNRKDLEDTHPWKWELCLATNGDNLQGGKEEAIRDRDVLIALSTPGPGVIQPEWIKTMKKDPIVFACANPDPEIWPWDAKEAGARIVATGRSDFPNQVNNSLGFPGLFRGVFSVRASVITDEMCLAASYALYQYAKKQGLQEDYIIPRMEEWEVYVEEALAVAAEAEKQQVSHRTISREDLKREMTETIRRAQNLVQDMVKEGYILLPGK